MVGVTFDDFQSVLPPHSLWAIDPAIVDGVPSPGLTAAALIQACQQGQLRYQPQQPRMLHDKVAAVDLAGPLTRWPTAWTARMGGTAMAEAQRLVEQVVADPKIKALLVVIDSPGGSVGGVGELAASLARATKEKALWAVITGACCGAAYALTAACGKIYATQEARLGGLSVQHLAEWYGVPEDEPALENEESGDSLGLVEATERALAKLILSHRPMASSQQAAVTDNRNRSAAEALDAGLIDGTVGSEAVAAGRLLGLTDTGRH